MNCVKPTPAFSKVALYFLILLYNMFYSKKCGGCIKGNFIESSICIILSIGIYMISVNCVSAS